MISDDCALRAQVMSGLCLRDKLRGCATLRLTPPTRVQRSKQDKANDLPHPCYDNPWSCEQYAKREENLTEFTLA